MIIYQEYAKELLSKLHRISGIINHNLSSGNYHEAIVKSYLKNFLSNRFSVKTGFIRNPETLKSSNQIDILIVDENIPSAYLFKEDDFAIVLPQAVVCAIEIKTKFNKKTFIDIAKKAENFRNICGVNLSFFYSFCFENEVQNKETIYNWYKDCECQDDIFHYSQSIYILDSYIIKSFPEPICIPSGSYFLINEKKKELTNEIVLAQFLLDIIKNCEIHDGQIKKNTVGNYFENQYDGLFEIKHVCMKYGIGKVPMEKFQGSNGQIYYERV